MIFFNRPKFNKNTNLTGSKKYAIVSFDPGLIDKLIKDHKKLIKILGIISNSRSPEQLPGIPRQLRAFKLALQTHLVVENVRFYTYVQLKLKANSENMMFVKDLKLEMDRIAHTVVKFTNHYTSSGINKNNAKIFFAELDALGEMLTNRIEAEENSLYTLYVR